MQIIGLFFPALISIIIRHTRDKEQLWEMPVTLIRYGIYVLYNVLLTTVIITYGLNNSGVTVDAFESFPFFTKYVTIAIMVAIFLPYVEEMIKKYIRVTFTVKVRDEKENHMENN